MTNFRRFAAKSGLDKELYTKNYVPKKANNGERAVRATYITLYDANGYVLGDADVPGPTILSGPDGAFAWMREFAEDWGGKAKTYKIVAEGENLENPNDQRQSIDPETGNVVYQGPVPRSYGTRYEAKRVVADVAGDSLNSLENAASNDMGIVLSDINQIRQSLSDITKTLNSNPMFGTDVPNTSFSYIIAVEFKKVEDILNSLETEINKGTEEGWLN